MISIVFVCSGNTCRSPMAAAIASARFADVEPAIEFRSAGTTLLGGQPASSHAAFVVADRGGSLATHVSTPVDEGMMQRADIVLTMTKAHRAELLRRWPDLASRVQTLGAAAGEEQTEVGDPFGGDLAAYEVAYREIERLIAAFEPALRARIADDATTNAGTAHPEKGNGRQ